MRRDHAMEPGPEAACPVISWREYVERFQPAFHFNYREAFEHHADELEIRVYQPGPGRAVRLDGDLVLDDARPRCVVVPGDLIVSGSVRLERRAAPVLLHVQGRLQADNLFLRGQGYTRVEGDLEIAAAILVTNAGAEINAPKRAGRAGSMLLVQGDASARVILKSHAPVLFFKSVRAHAVGDYGFCELHAAPGGFRFVVPFHELVFSGAAGLPPPVGLFDEDDGVVAEGAEGYLAAHREALAALPLARADGETPPMHAATLAYDKVADLLKAHGQVSPSRYRAQARELLRAGDFAGVLANADRWAEASGEPFFYAAIVSACERLKDLPASVAWARRGLERFAGQNFLLRTLLGNVLALGRPAEAWQDWRRFGPGLDWAARENDNVLQLAMAAAILAGQSVEAHAELAAGLRAVRSESPSFWFNAACLGARAGALKDAAFFAWQALRHGKPRADLDAEGDLEPVRREPLFQAVLELGDAPPARTAALARGEARVEIALEATRLSVREGGGVRTLELGNPADALAAFFDEVAAARARGLEPVEAGAEG
ncbi:MAG TPA: hypothetical protein PK668_12800 [Myxococcota bacterium]|nr:hypothetical protein [Myxococcota bacterium]HRY93651.1 hypothetical protein [Myxococcota bacterium]HSA20983.1 hypothetical protein [Myxococcota bacterium]